MRQHHRSPNGEDTSRTDLDSWNEDLAEEGLSLLPAPEDQDNRPPSAIVRATDVSGVVLHDENDWVHVGHSLPRPEPSDLVQPLANARAPESLSEQQFLVNMRADQLARLWLREPTLTSNDVQVWCNKKGKWVSALSVAEVSREISHARTERVRMLSALTAARNSVTILPPKRSHHRPGCVGVPKSLAESAERLLAPPRIPVQSHHHWHKAKFGLVIAYFEDLVVRSIWMIRRPRVMNRLRAFIARQPRPQIGLFGTCVAVLLTVPLGIRHMHRVAAAHNLTTSNNHPTYRVTPILITAPPLPMPHEFIGQTAKPAESERAGLGTSKERQGDTHPVASKRARTTVLTRMSNGKPNGSASTKQGTFDATEARRAIDGVAARAVRECVDGSLYGNVTITFWPSGYGRDVRLQLAGDSFQRSCVAQLFGGIKMSSFLGAPVTIQKVP
jgi:hypothetical protein